MILQPVEYAMDFGEFSLCYEEKVGKTIINGFIGSIRKKASIFVPSVLEEIRRLHIGNICLQFLE